MSLKNRTLAQCINHQSLINSHFSSGPFDFFTASTGSSVFPLTTRFDYLLLNLLSCPHGIYGVHRADEDFTVAMLTGLCAGLNGRHGCVHLCLFNHDGEHNLWQFAVDPIAHLNASLLPSAKDVHFRQRNDAAGLQRLDNLLLSIGANNSSNHSHTRISTHTWLSSTNTG